MHKRIHTTKVKAKEASRLADRLVTIGKEDTLASRRRAYSILQNRDLVAVLFNEIAPLFRQRNGGYTRVMLVGKRRGDNAEMAILEFVEKPEKVVPTKKEEKKKTKLEKKEPKPKVEKKEVPEIDRAKKEDTFKEKKIEPKKAVPPPPKEPEKKKEPEPKPEQKPGFFRKLFGRKKSV